MLLDGLVFWSIVQSEGLETTNKIMIQFVEYKSNNVRNDMTVQYYTH